MKSTYLLLTTAILISDHIRFLEAFDGEKRFFALSCPSVFIYQGQLYVTIFREISLFIFTNILFYLFSPNHKYSRVNLLSHACCMSLLSFTHFFRFSIYRGVRNREDTYSVIFSSPL